MIPSSLELNSDDFPFFGDLKRTSGSREKLEKSSFENCDNHHQPRDETMMMIRKPKSVARCQKLGQFEGLEKVLTETNTAQRLLRDTSDREKSLSYL